MSIADRKEVIRTENNSEVPPAMLMAAFEKFKDCLLYTSDAADE